MPPVEPRPLHIGKFVPPPYAGVEAHVDTLLRNLPPEAQGTLVAGESPMATIGEPPPYRLLAARSYGRLASATLSPGVLWLARRELRAGRCNLLHVHAPNPWGDFAALAAPESVPVVMTWHSDIVRQRRIMLAYRAIQRRALARADRIVVFTPKHYESSRQLHQVDCAAKMRFVPIGIDFDRLGTAQASEAMRAQLVHFAAGRPTILTVGRHVYYKGYDYLLAAFARLRAEAVLVMVGTGVLSESLKRQARELGIEARVLFLGEVDDAALAAALHHCDFFCLPSIEPSEAFGIASAEAMACGKPTVVCELGNGVNHLNQHGRTSLAVPPRDVPALADAMEQLLRDDALRRRMGLAANEWVRTQFSIPAMKAGMLAVYRELL
jgi:glycosyltransferase involved in cell wall biosynthesis